VLNGPHVGAVALDGVVEVVGVDEDRRCGVVRVVGQLISDLNADVGTYSSCLPGTEHRYDVVEATVGEQSHAVTLSHAERR
jgi:hypothetical protein